MTVLLVEDEAPLAETLTAALERDGYRVLHAASADEAWTTLAETPVDLIALDVMLPGDDDAGFEIARALRDGGDPVPILFLTARDAVEDRIRGLDLGGDDYLVKPFSLGEFRARIRAQLRREAQLRQDRFERGPLEVDFRTRRVRWRGLEVDLSTRELALLECFARNPDRVYASDELLDRLFPGADSGTRVVRVYVHYLRQKLGPEAVATVAGGYRLGI